VAAVMAILRNPAYAGTFAYVDENQSQVPNRHGPSPLPSAPTPPLAPPHTNPLARAVATASSKGSRASLC